MRSNILFLGVAALTVTVLTVAVWSTVRPSHSVTEISREAGAEAKM